MANEQGATLLYLNEQAQVVAPNAVGSLGTAENSRIPELGQRIKWAAGLLGLDLTYNRISNNFKWYFTRKK